MLDIKAWPWNKGLDFDQTVCNAFLPAMLADEDQQWKWLLCEESNKLILGQGLDSLLVYMLFKSSRSSFNIALCIIIVSF